MENMIRLFPWIRFSFSHPVWGKIPVLVGVWLASAGSLHAQDSEQSFSASDQLRIYDIEPDLPEISPEFLTVYQESSPSNHLEVAMESTDSVSKEERDDLLESWTVLPDNPEENVQELLVFESLPEPTQDLLAVVEDGVGQLDRGRSPSSGIETSDQLFLMAQEGKDAVKFDEMNYGQILLIEDLTASQLIVRIQRLSTAEAKIALFTDDGKLLYQQTRKSLGAGFEFSMDYSGWPAGTYRLRLQLEGRNYAEKIIQKPQIIDLL